MNNDMMTAKQRLAENGYTCVLCLDGAEYHSTLRGVKPLLTFLESPQDFSGFSAADKVVGAGAAQLYVLLGVRAVWADVISEEAKGVLESNGIAVSYRTVVPYIINRAGDGRCPIETAVAGITDAQQALRVIKQTLRELTNS